MKALCFKLLMLLFILFLASGCSESIKESDLIIKVDKESLVETSEKDVIAYFEKNKDGFNSISTYTLNNEKVFGTRPVILHKEFGISHIMDNAIKKLVDTFMQEGMVKNISSLNDNVKNARFLVGYEYGVYEQGIRFVSDKKVIDEDKTKYNYVKEYRDLGNGWFYYVYYYNKIKDEDKYRESAWDMLSEQDKKSVRNEWSKAIVTLEDWKSVGHKTGKTMYSFVVSVCFNTDVDGLLGPIVMYFDPSTKKVIGGDLRF